MKDAECTLFLQWALPKMRMRWAGFRKVRGQVCKRIGRRITELGLPGLTGYRLLLAEKPDEWKTLEKLCRVTISRFYRDIGTFELLGRELMPDIARTASGKGELELRAWCAGCASGEEPYTLKILWEFLIKQNTPGIKLLITATDSDPKMLERAEKGCYRDSSVKELPLAWREKVFHSTRRLGGDYCLKSQYREGIEFIAQDIRHDMPEGGFHVVFCRNLVFTYFDDELQKECLEKITERIVPGGALIIGGHETLPQPCAGLEEWRKATGIYIKSGGGF
jgi:chemotaxis protein methyltransferase CheR